MSCCCVRGRSVCSEIEGLSCWPRSSRAKMYAPTSRLMDAVAPPYTLGGPAVELAGLQGCRGRVEHTVHLCVWKVITSGGCDART